MHADCIRVPLMTSLRNGGGDGGGGADGGGGDRYRGCEGGGAGGRDSQCSNGDRVGGHQWPLSAIMQLNGYFFPSKPLCLFRMRAREK